MTHLLPPTSPGRDLLLLFLLPVLANVGGDINHSRTNNPSSTTVGGVWPLPQKQVLQDQYVALPDTFQFKIVGESCDILEDAVTRYMSLLKTNWRYLTKFDLVNTAPNVVGQTDKLKIRLNKVCEKYPYLHMDEKYTLEITKSSSVLEADSIWGILRGLETFCQLPAPASNEKQLIIQVQKIEDFPQYPHRGLLIDTSRHWLPLATLEKQLDVMSYNKFNVLHWHIVDDQSFPYQSKKFPALSQKGSFGQHAVYTQKYMSDIVEYARLRGIRVIPEFDTPGHTGSMEPAQSQIHCHVPSAHNGKPYVGPLDPTKNETYNFVHDLLLEAHGVFPDTHVHLGGEDVDSYCWNQNPAIKAFMDARHWDAPKLQTYYMQNILKDVKKMNSTAIVREEVFTRWHNFKDSGSTELNVTLGLGPDTIVQAWKGGMNTVKAIATNRIKVINSDGWYLDDLKQDFEEFYERGLDSIDLTAEERKLLLGGEACMWGERVDDTNIEARVWPRACAMAEHLWSAPHEKTIADTSRISEHVCRLRRRGVQAQPSHSISYCTETLPRPNFGASGGFFSMNSIRELFTLHPVDDKDEEPKDEKEKYEVVNKPDLQEKSAKSTPAETLTALRNEEPNVSRAKDEVLSAAAADEPVKDDKSAAPAVEAGTTLLLLVLSLAVLLNLNFQSNY